jgi:uncharacterized membrane protein YczE
MDALVLVPLLGATLLGWASNLLRGWRVRVLGVLAALLPALQWGMLWFFVIRHENLKDRLTAFQVNLILVVIGTPVCVALFLAGRYFSQRSRSIR